MSPTVGLLIVAAVWVGTGIILALVMGRLGHAPWTWAVLGIGFGPLAIPGAWG